MDAFALITIALGIAGIVFGLALIGMGVGYYHAHDKFLAWAEELGLPDINMWFIIVGLIIFVLSSLSFMSIVKDVIVCKIIYCLILGVIAAGLIILAIMVLVARSEVLLAIERTYNKLWKYRNNQRAAVLLDSLNQYLKCCGAERPTDYGAKIPPSCCDEPVDGVCSTFALYELGCRKTLLDFIDSKFSLIGYLSLTIGIVLAFLALGTLLSPV